MKECNEYILKTPGRNVVLLIGNASSNGRMEDIPSLSNVEAIYLPKNTTPFLQPLDAGVIASLKRIYRKRQYERALLLIDNEDSKNLYNVNVSQAMKWISSTWDSIESRIIHNCSEETRSLEPHLIHNIEQREETIYAPNFEDEDDCIEFISDSELVRIGLNQL